MNAKQFIEANKDNIESRRANFTSEQLVYLNTIADNHDLSFEDAVLLVVNKGLQDMVKEQVDRYMNPN